MSGKDYIVKVSSDGTDTGTMTPVENQGDLTINPGKPINRFAYKDTAKSSQGNDGWSASFSFGVDEPLGTGQALVFNAYDNGGDAYITIESATTGALKWSGPIKLAIQTLEHPVSGDSVIQVEMSEDGVVARGVTA